MTGLDSNILIQLAVTRHLQSVATTELFLAEIARGETFALPSLVVTEFLHVVTDIRRFDPIIHRLTRTFHTIFVDPLASISWANASIELCEKLLGTLCTEPSEVA